MPLRRICLLLCFLLIGTFSDAWGAPAARMTPRVVKVGFFAFDGYHMQDKAGARSGYGYEILQHMVLYCDWKYQYEGFDKSWADMQQMLENGEIDLLTSAQKTPDRLNRFAFSDRPIGTSATLLTVRAGDTRYFSHKTPNLNGIRVGMIRENSRNQSFAAFARKNGFRPEPVYFDSTDAMLRALHSGGVDAVVTSNLRATRDEWILASFDPAPFYVMVRKNDSLLLADVNHALEQLAINDGTLSDRLFKRYYAADSGKAVPLTSDEWAFITDANSRGAVFRAILSPDRAPYSFIQDGKYRGILHDLAQIVFQRTGLNVEIANTPDRAAYHAAGHAPDTDIRIDTWYNPSASEADGYTTTSPYLSETVSLVRLKNHMGQPVKSVAAIAGADLTEHFLLPLRDKYTVVQHPSMDDAIRAVLEGEQDAACLYTLSAERAVALDTTNSLTSETMRGSTGQFCLTVRQNLDSRLGAILNKAVLGLSPEELVEIAAAYPVYPAAKLSLMGLVYAHPLLAVAAVALFFSLLLLTLLYVTQRARYQREHRQAQEDARKKIALQDALNAAEQASAAKGAFMSRISHEIRTPLNAIIGYMTIAADEPASPKLADCVEKTQIAARHLLSLINEVLDISAIESGRMKIDAAPFDLKQLLFALVKMFEPQARAKSLRLSVLPQGVTEENLIGDRLRVSQILMNLLSNALKFTPAQGSVSLLVTQPFLTKETVHLRFVVKDTGLGMDAEYIRHIWTPFEQENAGIAARFGGSGLGLSITRNLVNMMQGKITVHSEKGKGSQFTVELPFGRDPTPAPVRDRKLDFSGVRALVVDDDSESTDYISRLLLRCKVKSVTVHSGEEALQAVDTAMAEGKPFSLCLMDWQMPGMDGIETVKRLRAHGATIPTIIVTGYDFSAIQDEARAAGVTQFISKPLFQSTLFDLLMINYGKLQPVSGTVAPRDRARLAGMRLLLAEDNAINMEIATTLLSKPGLIVDEATDGRQAVDMFLASAPGTYKAILMDIQMPVMDGLEATRIIRASSHPEAATIPILAMTANAFVEDISASLAAGMNEHFSKPLDFDKLLDRLEAFA